MSDETSQPDNAPPAGATTPGATTQVSLSIVQQFLKDLSFESPKTPDLFLTQMKQPEINVNFNVGARTIRDDLHESTIDIEARATTDGETVFLVELTYAAIVRIGGAPDELRRQLLGIEVPRLLFPFAREILADAVRNGGFPPLLINPIDFQSLYAQNAAQATAQPTSE